jgi:D-beta-D-heptose 7-phosphate kinase/D-beta-D-heptose 1-phosphate adenosyltransferase
VSRPRIVVVGDCLLDRDVVGEVSRVTPDAPVPVVDEQAETVRPGGAGLAALLATRDRAVDVTLITALAGDAEGQLLGDLLRDRVELVELPLAGSTPVKTRVRAGGQSLLRIDRGQAGPPGPLTDAALDALGRADAVLVSDYGRGLTGLPALRAALAGVARRAPVVWDPHPRGGAPVAGCQLVTPNLAEAASTVGRRIQPGGLGAAGTAAGELVARWRAGAVAVTLGSRGAVLSFGAGPPTVIPAPSVSTVDTCGAGDRFAAAATTALAGGALPTAAVTEAVLAAAEFVAAGGAAALRPDRPHATKPGGEPPDGVALAERVRSAGGTVVATGGCFDLLHAGHVAVLAAARRLGDCLVVCVNSDRSVRRLKGADRPVVGQADRASVLRALECVDATVIFDEDEPSAALRRIRPHLWVKGGDYAGMPLPEEAVLAGWGGQAVLLPYVDGLSTTNLIQQCRTGGMSRPEGEIT